MSGAAQGVLAVEVHAERAATSHPGLDGVLAVLREAVLDRFPSGFDLAVVNAEGIVVRAFGGTACIDAGCAVRRDTRYDLASLTKVVATTTVVMRLVEEGRVDLSDLVVTHLADFPRDDLTIAELCTHTSGLVPHRPFFLLADNAREIRRALYAEVLAGGQRGEVRYSDLNFIILGWLVEAVTGRRLDEVVAELVTRPLAMDATRFRPLKRDRNRIAATERDGDQRRTPGLVWGSVHDGNAFALGGIAGHAGLFAPVEDLARFVGALVNPDRDGVLAPSTIAEMSRRRAGEPPEIRAIGWRLQPESWGAWPPGTIWHTGFTGTSLLVAPELGVGVIFLTNAVHPHRQLERQAAVRVALHEAVRAWLR